MTEELECEFCGEKSDDVEVMLDPYMNDMYDEQVYVPMCQDCRHDRLMSI